MKCFRVATKNAIVSESVVPELEASGEGVTQAVWSSVYLKYFSAIQSSRLAPCTTCMYVTTVVTWYHDQHPGFLANYYCFYASIWQQIYFYLDMWLQEGEISMRGPVFHMYMQCVYNIVHYVMSRKLCFYIKDITYYRKGGDNHEI